VNGLAPNTKDTGFVFSNPDLQVVMPTVFEDVAFSLANEKLSKDDVRIRTEAALAEVGILELQELSCYSLSSGQKQLLALASSLVRKPRLLVADEPTTLLDLPNTRRITKLLHSLDLQQLVVVTHDLELAETCQEVIWFEGGQVRKQGSSKQVIAAYLKACS
jgi:biotin transport system ATP-binding protein